MFDPGSLMVHVDHFITELSQAIMAEPTDYVAPSVFPIVPVAFQSNYYPIFDDSAFINNSAILRVPGQRVPGATFTMSKDNYFCDNYAAGKDNPWETAKNDEQNFISDELAARFCINMIYMKMELLFVSEFVATGKWATELDIVGAKWSVTTNPLFANIETSKIAVGNKIIKEPNIMATSRGVWGAIKQHPDFVSRMGANATKVVPVEIAASMLELDRILVSKAVYESADEGATSSPARAFPNHALMLYVPSRPAREVPAAGYTFAWDLLGAANLVFNRKLILQQEMVDHYEAHGFFDMKQTSSKAGYLFLNAI